MSSNRLFLAIPIPEPIRNELADKTVMLRGIKGMRVVPADNYHVTVYFFGSVEDERIPLLIKDIQKQLLGHSPFSLQTDQLTLFPKQHPRMIWLGFTHNYEFTELSKAIHPIVSVYTGHNAEEKEHLPHITCARIKKRDAQIPALLPINPHMIPVTYIELWKSISEKDGERYEPIHRLPL